MFTFTTFVSVIVRIGCRRCREEPPVSRQHQQPAAGPQQQAQRPIRAFMGLMRAPRRSPSSRLQRSRSTDSGSARCRSCATSARCACGWRHWSSSSPTCTRLASCALLLSISNSLVSTALHFGLSAAGCALHLGVLQLCYSYCSRHTIHTNLLQCVDRGAKSERRAA